MVHIPWRCRLSAEDFVANLATQSITARLGPTLAGSFLGRVKDRLASMGVHQVTRPLIGLLTVGRVSICSVR
jgi:hypothetical protein